MTFDETPRADGAARRQRRRRRPPQHPVDQRAGAARQADDGPHGQERDAAPTCATTSRPTPRPGRRSRSSPTEDQPRARRSPPSSSSRSRRPCPRASTSADQPRRPHGALADQHLPVAFVPSRATSRWAARARRTRSSATRRRSTCTVTAQNNGFTPASVSLTTESPASSGSSARRRRDARRRSRRPRCRRRCAGARSACRPSTPGAARPGSSRWPPSASTRSRSATRTSSTSASRRSCTTARPTRARRQLQRLHRRRRRGREDNNCCNLPDRRRPGAAEQHARPVLDRPRRHGRTPAGIYAATLTDGVDTWIVVEWQVNVFGTDLEPPLPGLDRRQRRRRTSASPTTPPPFPPIRPVRTSWSGRRTRSAQGDDAGHAADGGPGHRRAPIRRLAAR